MKRITNKIVASASLIIALAVSLDSICAFEPQARFAVFDIGGLSGDSSNAFGISDSGYIAGAAGVSGNVDFHAVRFSKSGLIDLGTFGGARSLAYDTNVFGEVVGWAVDGGGLTHAFLWRDGELEQLPALVTGTESVAFAVNGLGQIVGVGRSLALERHAMLWQGSEVIDLGAFNERSHAQDINELGQIVGHSDLESGPPVTAVLWHDGQMIDLGALAPNRESEAQGINDLSHIVGYSHNSEFRRRAFLWVDGKMFNLQRASSGIDHSSAWSINNKDQVVGTFQNFGSQLDRGFLWEQSTGMRSLDDLIPPRSDWRIVFGYDINNHGQIAGIGEEQFGNKWFRAVLLTPVEPELTLSDPVPGIAGETNTWTITGAQPGSKIILTYSLKGGGTVVPGCDKLDAVLQLNNPKIMKSAIADATGEATIQMYVPPAARNAGDILFQAVNVKDCEESQLVVFDFE